MLLFWFYRPSARWQVAAAAMLLVDVGSFARHPLPSLPHEFFTPPAQIAAFDRDRDGYTIFHRGAWRIPERLRHLTGSSALMMRNGLHGYSVLAWGFRTALEPDIDETALLPTHDLLDAMQRRGNRGEHFWSEPFALLANVRYIIDYRADATPENPIYITRVPNQGRYWFARALSRKVIAPGSALVADPFVPAAARILAIQESPSTATIDAQSTGAAFLVIGITRHKYWRVLIDGHEAPLVACNIAYQGLVVPAGRHRIELRYRNPLIAWGAGISALTLVAITVPTRRRRRLRTGS
jgi:hypothetical protein